jgi:hypothetical protein
MRCVDGSAKEQSIGDGLTESHTPGKRMIWEGTDCTWEGNELATQPLDSVSTDVARQLGLDEAADTELEEGEGRCWVTKSAARSDSTEKEGIGRDTRKLGSARHDS